MAILCAAVGAVIGSEKNLYGEGAILGLLFGPIGLVIVLLMPRPPDQLQRTRPADVKPPASPPEPASEPRTLDPAIQIHRQSQMSGEVRRRLRAKEEVEDESDLAFRRWLAEEELKKDS